MATYNGYDATWTYWDSDYSTGTINSTSNGTWNTWNDSPTSSSSVTYSSGDLWYVWCKDEIVDYDIKPGKVLEFEPPVLSTEEIRAQKAQLEIDFIWREILAEELKLEKEAAEVTAQELLMELIGENELEVYKETDRLFVKGRKYDYIIRKGQGVQRFNKDMVSDLCIHLKERYRYPATDNVIAMKLAIEADEERFLKLANGTNRARTAQTNDLKRAACM